MLPVIHTVIALPLAVRVIGPALRGIGTELLESAADLGAGPLRTWRSVQAPLLAPALVRAAGISAAVSLGEFGATSFLTRGDTKTVPIVIGELMGRPGPLLQQSAFAIATTIVVVVIASAAHTN
jgi:thiamine transport system permease protein